MPRATKRINRLPLVKWLAIELGAILLIGLAWSFENRLAFYSALIGGLIYLVPNVYFAHRMFQVEGAQNTRLIVGNMFRAESIKLALTAVFFAAVFILMEPVHVPALLFTFAVMVGLGPYIRGFWQPKLRR